MARTIIEPDYSDVEDVHNLTIFSTEIQKPEISFTFRAKQLKKLVSKLKDCDMLEVRKWVDEKGNSYQEVTIIN